MMPSSRVGRGRTVGDVGSQRFPNHALERGSGGSFFTDRGECGRLGIPLTRLLDATDAENRLIHEPVDARTPEQQFDRLWAESLLERVLSRLEEEFDGTGRSGRFAVLQTYLLEDRGTLSYADAAARLGMTESAVKAGVFRLRRRYGELVREEIANTVGDESEIEAELGHLLNVMS